MLVKCIKKPDEGYVARSVKVGKSYSVLEDDGCTFLLIDDNGNDYHYTKDHFEKI